MDIKQYIITAYIYAITYFIYNNKLFYILVLLVTLKKLTAKNLFLYFLSKK